MGNGTGPRIQAGTRSLTGGTTLPMRLWEGTLADNTDALVISPSLWEVDGLNDFYSQWNQQQEALIIEAALAPPPIGVFPSPLPVAPGVLAPKPGLLSVLFRDGVPAGGLIGNVLQRPAIYQMFIQVERLP